MFKEFIKKLSREIQKDLPGFSAQKLMAPPGRKKTDSYLAKNIIPKKSAVLILLYPLENPFSVRTVLILRPEKSGGNHGGQISFPGGGIDDTDKNMSDTALRETEEEIGIDRSQVTLLGELSPLYIPVSNFLVHPFVGTLSSIPMFKIHPAEVSELLEVELNELLSCKNQKTAERFMKAKGSVSEVPCYEINGKIIWGATAMIIAELMEIVRRMS